MSEQQDQPIQSATNQSDCEELIAEETTEKTLDNQELADVVGGLAGDIRSRSTEMSRNSLEPDPTFPTPPVSGDAV